MAFEASYVNAAMEALPASYLRKLEPPISAKDRALLERVAEALRGDKPIDAFGRPVVLDMNCFAAPRECATAACIAGHAAIVEYGGPMPLYFERFAQQFANRHRELCYVVLDKRPHHMIHIANEQAVRAIENYLSTGECRWHEILTGRQILEVDDIYRESEERARMRSIERAQHYVEPPRNWEPRWIRNAAEVEEIRVSMRNASRIVFTP